MKGLQDLVTEMLKNRDVKVLDVTTTVLSEGCGYVELGLDLEVVVRESMRACYECLWEECASLVDDEDLSDEEMEKVITRCVEKRVSELDLEYGVPAFRFSYGDGKCSARLSVRIDDDGVERSYYDTLRICCVATIRRSMSRIDLEYEAKRIVETVTRLVNVVKTLLNE